ncbi:hypothetical protein [Parabacteroides gordonii]|uniref:Uncharacterized protein n=1 Tax=Parabacteroides gordonii MS-1 = DSM 23371 TaxID=1203610 RepID=A0A0F5IV80_9BACT|nr:hypothetical protein [Parabacteroides gordonii]KKB49474.1 hypothetical protein HMPREF1536_04538 [Parabacteroides gordonii MS-1 = DSM 23371]MCA5585741.1 hypothetical protein [Parabacteroides gordonii]
MATEDKCDIIIAMLEELKSGNKNQKSQQMDFSKIESLSERLEGSINATSDATAKMERITDEVRKPVIRERRITIDIVSKEIAFLLIGMGLAISVLGSALYFSARPNYDRIDNDLKYRYIKMKGEATPERISELENLFEINRDNTKIRQMSKDVEDYERAVKQRATIEEQARRKALETEKLNNKMQRIKKRL